LFGCPPPVIRDYDCLHQHVEFQLLPTLASLLSDLVDGRVESL
jgi:hypothetical protein